MRLEGKTALITGAGSGIGRESATLFAAEGAAVVVVDIEDRGGCETVEAIQRASGRAVYVHADVAKASDCARMIASAEKEFGKLNVLFNNAGIMHSKDDDAVSTDEAIWDLTMNVNAKGVFLGCKYVIPVMEKQGGGAIVNIASTSGIRFTGNAQVGYAATKAGVIQLSRVVAVQYAPKGIRVNTVVPGQLHTPMVEARLAKQRAGGDVAELLKQRQRRIPLAIEGDGRDTANAALFLASDEARFITGTEIVVDGGMTARCD